MSRLSAIVIAKNEERDLPACLESVKGLAGEIVVVDDESTDKTAEIAKRFGAKVFTRPFVDYASQKQAALERASGDWVLSIDADERVSPALAQEIREVISASPAQSAFEIPFEVRFMGKTLRFGGLGAEKHVRLFKRTGARFVGGKLHEGVETAGSVGRLRGKITHVPYDDVRDYMEKLERYTELAAKKRHEQGVRFNPLHHLLPFWEFFVRVFLRLGILDGGPGLVWAGLSSFHTWVKFLKLRELNGKHG